MSHHSLVVLQHVLGGLGIGIGALGLGILIAEFYERSQKRTLKANWVNQWSAKKGSRDITWIGVETSTFPEEWSNADPDYPRFRIVNAKRNIHAFIGGMGVCVWL